MQVSFNGTQVKFISFSKWIVFFVYNHILCHILVQTLRGLNSTEFINNPVAVASWTEAVRIACASNMSDYVRVDIVSLEDIASRRLSAHDVTSFQKTLALKLAVLVGFKVSYTLEDFNSDNPAVTTQTLKDNYARSVANETFYEVLAEEIEKRTNDSAALLAKIEPAEVTFSKSFVAVQTMEKPTGKFHVTLFHRLICVANFNEVARTGCDFVSYLSCWPFPVSYLYFISRSFAHLLTESSSDQCHRRQLCVHHHHA